jgi:hypothetical protein
MDVGTLILILRTKSGQGVTALLKTRLTTVGSRKRAIPALNEDFEEPSAAR